MKTTSEYLQLLSAYMRDKASSYGITRLAIFGSVARGEQTEDSDIDICFEGTAPNLLTFSRIKHELETLLGCPVDLIRLREHMDEFLKKEITKEALYV